MTCPQVARPRGESVFDSAPYQEWHDERVRHRHEALAPAPPSRYRLMTAVEMYALTDAELDALDAPFRNHAAAEYAWECAEIVAEIRAGTLCYRLACYDVSPIIQRIGGWAITSYGIEKLYGHYAIERERIIEENDWVEHLAEKATISVQSLADFTVLHDALRDGPRQLAGTHPRGEVLSSEGHTP